MKKTLSSAALFKDFPEYWYYARHLSVRQRTIIFNSFSMQQQEILKRSYKTGKWDDVFYRNVIDKKIDDLKERYGYDILNIRYKVLNNRSAYLPFKFWTIARETIGMYDDEYTYFIFGGIKAVRCKENKDVILLIKNI
jgi:hypothetical protein